MLGLTKIEKKGTNTKWYLFTKPTKFLTKQKFTKENSFPYFLSTRSPLANQIVVFFLLFVFFLWL